MKVGAISGMLEGIFFFALYVFFLGGLWWERVQNVSISLFTMLSRRSEIPSKHCEMRDCNFFEHPGWERWAEFSNRVNKELLVNDHSDLTLRTSEMVWRGDHFVKRITSRWGTTAYHKGWIDQPGTVLSTVNLIMFSSYLLGIHHIHL